MLSKLDPALLRLALTHRSYLNEDPSAKESNERLEFLGDSVLSLLTSDYLFNKYPDEPEGKLTNYRSALVRTQTLGKAAQKLNLGQQLLMSRGEERSGGRENLSLLADAFEAVLGAIYLDQGLKPARMFLEENLFNQATQENFDFKSQLQEILQKKHGPAPIYKLTGQEGPDHAKTFTISVFAGPRQLATGVGRSKQEAEQEAARIALGSLKS